MGHLPPKLTYSGMFQERSCSWLAAVYAYVLSQSGSFILLPKGTNFRSMLVSANRHSVCYYSRDRGYDVIGMNERRNRGAEASVYIVIKIPAFLSLEYSNATPVSFDSFVS